MSRIDVIGQNGNDGEHYSVVDDETRKLAEDLVKYLILSNQEGLEVNIEYNNRLFVVVVGETYPVRYG